MAQRERERATSLERETRRAAAAADDASATERLSFTLSLSRAFLFPRPHVSSTDDKKKVVLFPWRKKNACFLLLSKKARREVAQHQDELASCSAARSAQLAESVTAAESAGRACADLRSLLTAAERSSVARSKEAEALAETLRCESQHSLEVSLRCESALRQVAARCESLRAAEAALSETRSELLRSREVVAAAQEELARRSETQVRQEQLCQHFQVEQADTAHRAQHDAQQTTRQILELERKLQCALAAGPHLGRVPLQSYFAVLFSFFDTPRS